MHTGDGVLGMIADEFLDLDDCAGGLAFFEEHLGLGHPAAVGTG